MMKTIEELLVSSLFLFYSAFNIASCQDTIVYKGLIAIEMSNGIKYSPYFDGYDGLTRSHLSSITVNSTNIDSIYISNNLFIEDNRRILTKTMNEKTNLSNMGNLLIINKKRKKEDCLVFYKFYSVEIEIQFSELMLLNAPNFEKKKLHDRLKLIKMPIYFVLKVNSIEPYLIKNQYIQIK
ncbi:MAG: hypothetical protein H3C31_03115 [Brumimicrobium sp.]|nr:hypothetical protein [Brumimicrobium sp.]